MNFFPYQQDEPTMERELVERIVMGLKTSSDVLTPGGKYIWTRCHDQGVPFLLKKVTK